MIIGLYKPDRGGNPNLRPEKITAFESTLGYNTPSGGINITAFQCEIDDYIEKVIRQEGTRFVERQKTRTMPPLMGLKLRVVML